MAKVRLPCATKSLKFFPAGPSHAPIQRFGVLFAPSASRHPRRAGFPTKEPQGAPTARARPPRALRSVGRSGFGWYAAHVLCANKRHKACKKHGTLSNCAYEDAHDRYNGCNASNEASALQCGHAELSLSLALSFSTISLRHPLHTVCLVLHGKAAHMAASAMSSKQIGHSSSGRSQAFRRASSSFTRAR